MKIRKGDYVYGIGYWSRKFIRMKVTDVTGGSIWGYEDGKPALERIAYEDMISEDIYNSPVFKLLMEEEDGL